MSRGGRPSERAKDQPHKRNLIGPHEILERIEAAGGIPDGVIENMADQPRSAATEKAAEAMDELMGRAADQLRPVGAKRATLNADKNQQIAWMLSVTNSMKESAPRRNWCRHIRAADPNVTEIRTVAVPKAGIWLCLECLQEAGPSATKADLWPNECDLCGAKTTMFNGMLGNLPGCHVELHVCDHCAGFIQSA